MSVFKQEQEVLLLPSTNFEQKKKKNNFKNAFKKVFNFLFFKVWFIFLSDKCNGLRRGFNTYICIGIYINTECLKMQSLMYRNFCWTKIQFVN